MTTTPFFLSGNFAPVMEEVTATDLPVTGALPRELAGRFVRNGPNPHTGTSNHWFIGDGMLHGVELHEGHAAWYRNRYVRTRSLSGDGTYVDDQGHVDLTVDAANTHVVGHAGRILALVENGYPYEVTPDLDTVGPYDFDGRLRTAMTAHPKLDPATGELHFFGYGFMPPYLTYHVADAAGTLIHSEEITVRGPTMMHDFNLTERHVVFMDLPIVFDLDLAMQETMPYRWDDGYGARLGVLPRGGTDADMRWYEIEPCYVFHPLNAFDGDGTITLDVMRYPKLWAGSNSDFAEDACLTRWTIDLDGGTVKEEQLDDRGTEFPRVDPRVVGRTHRYGYAVQTAGDDMTGVLVKYGPDGQSQTHDFGRGREAGEPVFVPAADGRAEDEGWIMTYVYDQARDTSDFVVLDATAFEGPPVASVPLPQRVPAGFHGSWIADA
ncbi:MAG TPA: carotenoid oxygenase family protein [Acidimicrobiia bacterium]|nr:carotenoid oxygenase family protein [Acidimicrobiia bacterium]